MAKRRLIPAINDALFEEMARDERIILFGEDVEISMFGDTKGLRERFGPDRVRDTPICEALLTGMTVGMAAAGYRPVLHMMFANFIYTGFDAIANQVAKLRLMTGGQMRLPITIIAGYGGGRSTAAQHSDAPYPLFMNLGGIQVAVPSTPVDAKGLMKSALRGDNPTIFLEAGGRGGDLGEVPDEDYTTPFGRAVVRQAGDAATLVAIGAMVKPALQAAKAFHDAHGLQIEVIDPLSLAPFDKQTLLTSVRKTGRLVIVDEARDCCGAAAWIAALAADEAFEALRAPVKRVSVPDICMPYAPPLEKLVLPDVARITAALAAVTKVAANPEIQVLDA